MHTAPTPNAYKILVVDDDPDIVELLEYNLRKEGYVVASAPDGRKALEVAPEFGPDIILLDVMMPNLDGIAACRQLREMPKFKDTYIIFLTARAEEFSEVAAFDAGADDFIAKPIKPRALLSRLAAFVRRDQDPQQQSDTIEVNGLTIDRTGFAVYQNGKKLACPKRSSSCSHSWQPPRTKSSTATSCCRTSGATMYLCWPALWMCTCAKCARKSATTTSRRSRASATNSTLISRATH